jgi:glyceraldehyde 3-phosphate dehydrogenase
MKNKIYIQYLWFAIFVLMATVVSSQQVDPAEDVTQISYRSVEPPDYYPTRTALTKNEMHVLDTLTAAERTFIESAYDPPAIGVVRDLTDPIRFSMEQNNFLTQDEISVSGGRLTRVTDDLLVFTTYFESKKADEIRIFFAEGNFPYGVEVNLFSRDDYAFNQPELVGELDEHGFYTTTTFADYLYLQVVIPLDKVNDNVSFAITRITHVDNRYIPDEINRDCFLDANCSNANSFTHIDGFGRIGRLLARELIQIAGNGSQLRLRAIVTRGNTPEEIKKRISLFRNDSVHGAFRGVAKEDLDNKCLYINGHVIHMIAASNPEDVDYTAYGIKDALLIDNTGIFRDRESLGRHLKAKGIAKVLLTAPGKGDIPNVVYGVNQNSLNVKEETIYSAASCTTNAIVPGLKVLTDELGIVKGHLETIHAYTNDQNLLDNFHKKSRRGRSAPLNMVITETGAGSAAAKAIPSLKGKITSNAVRVPTPNVSLAILTIDTEKKTTVEEVNNFFLKAALKGELIEQIRYSTSTEFVSSDGIGDSCACIFDAPATKVSEDGKTVIVYLWYDNEYGYSCQVVRLAKHIGEVKSYRYY